MARPTKEQIAWFQELWREIMGDVPDADIAQSWFEEFPDTTKKELRKMLELLNTPEARAAMEADRREKRRRTHQAELAARRARGNATGMNIMILTYAKTSSLYAATLMSRGHLVTIFGGGVISPSFAEEFEDYDGCLLLGTEPELLEIADIFEGMGKKVWRQLADIPRELDRSGP
jgi:hypothetical protein